MEVSHLGRVEVRAQCLQKRPIPTPVAIIGLPSGLEPRHDRLKALVKSGKIAAIPGRYTDPASRACLYYTDAFKTWIEPISVDILPIG